MGKPTFTPIFLSPSALKRPQVSQALSPLYSFDKPTIIVFSSNFKLDKRAIFSFCNSTFSDNDMVIFPATIGAKTNCSPSE